MKRPRSSSRFGHALANSYAYPLCHLFGIVRLSDDPAACGLQPRPLRGRVNGNRRGHCCRVEVWYSHRAANTGKLGCTTSILETDHRTAHSCRLKHPSGFGSSRAFSIYAPLLYGFVELLRAAGRWITFGTVQAAPDRMQRRRMNRVGVDRVVEPCGSVQRRWPRGHGACSGLACADTWLQCAGATSP